MKKILAVILCLTFVLAAFGSMAVLAEEATEPTPVEGFAQDDEKKEFRVSTADGLMEVARVINAGGDTYATYNIFIDADIDMAGKTWKPIAAAQANNYRGTFDGQGHTITGLAVQNYSNSLGLIGYAGSGVVVKDVHLRGISFHATKPYCGAIIGRLENIVEVPSDAYALVTGCTVKGSLSVDEKYAGGLVGAIQNGKAVQLIEKDAEGNDVKVDRWFPANLRVENCAVDMNLYARDNYAAGILAGDSFQNDDAKSDYKLPTVVCKNVFVTGSYKSPVQASGFIGYMNKANVTVENCFSAAKVEGNPTQSGSFFSRTRKCILTVRECYSISEMPFSGELENLANCLDAEGNYHDLLTIVNSYAMQPELGVNAKLCTKLTTLAAPTAPAEGATAEEIAAYEEALALYNNLVIVNVNQKNYGIADVATPDEAGNLVVTLEVPSKHQQELLVDCERIVPTLFAAGSKQMELFNAYLTAMKCNHTEIRELATSQYIATNATCTAQATYYKSCAACELAFEETFAAGELAPHTWADRWGGDETTHFHACTVCREATTDVGEHTYGEWVVEKEATVSKEGKKVRECTVCAAEQEEAIPKLPAPVEPEQPKEEKKDGCGSAIGGASIIIMLAAAGAVVLRKKEN